MNPSRTGNCFYTNTYLKPSFTFVSLKTHPWFQKPTASYCKATWVSDHVFNHPESFRNRTRKEWEVSVSPRVVTTQRWQVKEINRKTSEVLTVPIKNHYRHKCQVSQSTWTAKTTTLGSMKNSPFRWKNNRASCLQHTTEWQTLE